MAEVNNSICNTTLAGRKRMKKDMARIFLGTLLLLSMFSLSFPISGSENSSPSDSLYVVEKEVEISPGNTTVHYVYFDITEGRLDPFLLFNITVSEPGWYHLEIWIDMFNPTDKLWGPIEYVSENETYWTSRTLRPYLIHWPIDMIEFLITEEAVHLGTFDWRWGPCTFYLSAHDYREYAMYIIADFEAVKPGVVECSLWDTSEFFLERIVEMIINNEPQMCFTANVTEVKILDEDEVAELPKFPEPPKPPGEFDIVVYANGTAP